MYAVNKTMAGVTRVIKMTFDNKIIAMRLAQKLSESAFIERASVSNNTGKEIFSIESVKSYV